MQLKDAQLFRQQAFINGEWLDADSGQTINVTNPATGEVIGTVPKMGSAETRRAIEAADKALPAWRALTAKERSNKLRRWFELMIENQDDLARLMTTEQGKPLAEAKGEIAYAASFIEWFAEEAKRVYGDTIPGHQPDKRLIVIKQPIGVTAAITPWNFPAAMITRKAGPALAAGCTMVLKPASQTPYSALALVELATRAGIPAGVLSVVTGSAGEVGGELTGNSLVRKLSFTGSTEIGRQLMEECAKDIKKVSLELGGNAPFIVFDDADLDKAVEGAIISKYRNNGQTCVCANRIYVQDGVYDAFAEKLKAAVAKLKIGNGLEDGTTTGPLIDGKAVAKVQEHIEDAVSKGAKVLSGGKLIEGNFFEPTILVDVPKTAAVAKEETFGPLAPLFRFKDEAEVIAMSNDTEFGLASYFYARDMSRVFRVAEALEYGMVGINTGLISNEVAPFGGIKASGLGREGSKYGIEDYLEIKYLCISV
ncbi:MULTISPECIES: NADP-dependent succinate-semialdehyde dehydrogenase [Pseudomonas]|jgi:succinate-semialdehyde dehydrogenase/glutarate-semialdehyde dehydrogenase|uniref:NADP-dependent succinate-semialdehyde dehydrogenase n=1 Tax=Pseudomonas putida TaxID=303 RepID=A0A379KES4_PSEPU|nr:MULTISPECIES: NADP-dependent succinate-semialdehyde dehydrogenase [Pseudomonas]QPN45284.1 NADP-dependent succinate-semialdehyde dehydrogenase [Priestia aryabhattai]KAF1310881.1 succinate-semialdehyde dehydrogenase I [Pseudomonas sp. SG-MS2]MBG6125708.1 succinate-semialdehyde dehydrogenase/glutarate-semialdehyde dehydrogenase [Pseudomonas sp. M2]MBM7398364.1 succinate-semialdehyde dehydrogenase/glutarate-semialdehyde dehydrogenase [Pseudomonas sp. M5]NSX21067.1 NADP-dependent succinate-semia